MTASAGCDRACLEGFVERYLDAVADNNPAAVPLSPNVRFTEDGQRLEPTVETAAGLQTGAVSLEPPAEPFGFYSFWPTTRFFDARTVYTEDARNTFDDLAHHVRAYPLRDRGGAAVPDAFVLATDESNRLGDYNDAVVVVRNVRPQGAAPLGAGRTGF